MANGLFNLKQVMQGIQQGGWVNQVGASTYGAYFGGSGSGQYLLGPTTSALNFSTGSFTVEFWAFLSAYGGGDLTIMFSASNASADFQFGASASTGVYWYNSGNQLTSNATAAPLGKWVHMALVRSGTTASLFCNGIRYSTTTNSAAVNLTNFNIGSYQGAPSAYMTKGWISNLRITNTAVYDPTATTLTLPLSNLTAISGTQLLTLQNATIVDNSTNALTITNNGSVAMQTVTPFGLSNYKPPAVEYLVVAGGGGGGGTNAGNAGGGGAGGLLTGIDPVPNGQTLLVTVGGGGNVGGSGATGSSGSASVFGSISTTGGGGGGAYSGVSPSSGGSGGGAGQNGYIGGQGTSGQGNIGGNSNERLTTDPYAGAGGGGAGDVGSSQSGTAAASYPQGGSGGSGVASSISGTVTAYAGGGGGSTHSSGSGIAVGGAGGGGNGHFTSTAGTSGTANTGGGGGGAGESLAGGNGGSGIVIVSYPDTYAAASAVTGATVSTSGSGSILFNGSNQYLSTSATQIIPATGDFTIEAWIYPTSFSGSPVFCGQGSAGDAGRTLFFISTGGVPTFTNGSSFTFTSTGTVSLNTWTYIAFTRSGSTGTWYINGASAGTGSLSGITIQNTFVTIGGSNPLWTAQYFTGYISNFRISDAARTISSTPTAPFNPSTANTKMLLLTASGAFLADASTNAYTFTNNGTSTWNQLSPFTVTGYKNRVYTWTSSGSITF